MKSILNICVVLLVLLSPMIAQAFDVAVTGTNVTISNINEPITSADGMPLTDLAHTSIYYDAGSGFVKAFDIPASVANGGGPINQSITVPIAIGQEANVRFKLTATDTSGNESADSVIELKRIDRLAPSAPK